MRVILSRPSPLVESKLVPFILSAHVTVFLVPESDVPTIPTQGNEHLYGVVQKLMILCFIVSIFCLHGCPRLRSCNVVCAHTHLLSDADHAGDRLTRRSRTGYVSFINNAPISWYSKKQGSVETSMFGSEFVALKTSTEANRGLRWKLRMMGIPIAGESYTFCDNASVVLNA